MTLSCRFLIDVSGVNSFEPTSQIEFAQGDAQNIYFQLIDSSIDRPDQGFFPSGRRYAPPVGSTLRVVCNNVDDAKVVSRAGVQAFPTQDASIWYFPVLTSDPLKGTVTLTVILTEPTRTLTAPNPKGLMLRVR